MLLLASKAQASQQYFLSLRWMAFSSRGSPQ
jgi:hypothetical protein